MKNSSVLALVVGGDIMYRSNSFVGTYGYLQGYFIACAMYFVICFPLAMLVQYLEKRSKRTPKAKKVAIAVPAETVKEA